MAAFAGTSTFCFLQPGCPTCVVCQGCPHPCVLNSSSVFFCFSSLLSPASNKLYALALHLECWLITPARPGRMSNKMGSLFLRNHTIPKHYLLPRKLATNTYYTSYTDILCILYYLRKQCD